ncbi:MAG: recombinase family protein, partial [Allgaiera sp.]|nr:recombinase family protein [Allgaiera sp.]
MTRAAIYARYSSDRQKATSLDDQIAMARKLCDERGWTVVAEHADAEMTGKNARRPGFQALRQVIKQGGIDIVVIESVDRMTRRVVDALSEFEMFEFQGVKLFSIAEGEQDFMKVLLLGYGAQLYSQSIAIHTERGRRAALESRKRLHSLAYGYRRKECDTGVNREIDPEQAEVVRRIFAETAEGKSATAIVKSLNRDGIPSPNGSKWSESILRGNVARNDGLLRNKLYIGTAQLGQTHRQDDPETGKRKVTITPEEEVIEAQIPELRIVPQEDWDAAQARILESAEKAKAAGNARAAHRNRYLLSGLMVCDCCGSPYVMRGKTRYGCRGNRDGSCTNRTTIRRDRIEARVAYRLREALLTPELTARFEAAIRAEQKELRKADPDQPLKRLRKQRKDLGSKLENLFKAIEDGMPYDRLKSRIGELETEIAETDLR